MNKYMAVKVEPEMSAQAWRGPKGRNVTNTDPRKAEIVKALKAASGATKVTLVKEVGPRRFVAHCLGSDSEMSRTFARRGLRRHTSLGYWQVTFENMP